MENTVLDLIQMEIENMPDGQLYKLPFLPIQKGEKVIGEIPQDLRKLWSLYVSWSKASAEEDVKAIFSSTEEEKKIHETRSCEIDHKSSLVAQILWVSVRDRFSLWEEDMIGIRDGWKIVRCG